MAQPGLEPVSACCPGPSLLWSFIFTAASQGIFHRRLGAGWGAVLGTCPVPALIVPISGLQSSEGGLILDEDPEAQGGSVRTPGLPWVLWLLLLGPETWQGFFYRHPLLVSAGSSVHCLDRSRGPGRGHKMGLEGILGARPLGGGSERGQTLLMASWHLPALCEWWRGPGYKLGRTALEVTGPLGLQPWAAQWLLQGGGDN